MCSLLREVKEETGAGFHSPLMLRKTIIIVTLAQIIRAVFVIYVDYIMMY